MESNAAETRGKRKADAISPTREVTNLKVTCSKLLTEKGEIVTFVNAEDEQDSPISDEEEDEDEKDPENMSDDNEEEDSDEEMDAFERDFYGDFDDEEESMGPEETEVEQKEHSLGDQKLTFKIFLAEDEDHGDEFTRWMQTIRVHCSYERKEIGRGFGRYVQRDRIRDSFWRDMEEPCQELSQIAFELFDRYGRLRTELKNHPIQKGTGVWGSELDLGSFFVIEDLLIDKEWRRKAIGAKIVTYLIKKSRARSRDPQFSLVVPGWLTRDIESDILGKTKDEQREIRVRAVDNAVSFYRSLGFRRIGASSCFGLATDASHPARAILPTGDFDPAVEEPDVDEGPEHESSADWGVDQNRKSWRLELLKDRLPLHHATITLPDSDLARNVKGYTPIEELESDLETKRTRRNHGMMTVDISDNFSGFAPEAISCLAALRSLGNLSQIQCARLKFGCTCGLCIDGFLSPRMSFALLCRAEITHDMLNEDVEDGETWCMMHDDLITHVAPDIQRNFATNKSYRQGFANIFHHAATTLRNNRPPTILNVLNECMDASEWPPHTKNFLQRGGEPESVLRIMFENTKDQDEWAGDGMHMEVFEDQVKALPECRNDHEFGFAALACGMPKLTRLYG
ncbi:hypothetical protein G7Y89_g7883 [Cudoniella acicularis]|uniref:N-acetyltransferase domain-containing protein n=1 Tax=Cudoniella acicularis TaxID=354080 RepID=A0A8H4W1J4_9HELO|nr:hypothetical protein G7Y89_g7883 [Cudoniella acicularis]